MERYQLLTKIMASPAPIQLNATNPLFNERVDEPGYASVEDTRRDSQQTAVQRRTADNEATEVTYAKVDKLRRNKRVGARKPAGGNGSELDATKHRVLATADSLIRNGNNSEAIQHLETALNDTSDTQLQKQIWRLLGNCHSSLRSYKKASVAYLHYVAMCRELGDFPGLTRGYCSLGINYMHLGLHSLAGNCFLQHLDNSRVSGNKLAMASAYNNLGILIKMLGKKGLHRVQQTSNMAGMEIVTSRLRKAISYFGEHLLLVEQLYDRPKQSAAFANLGSCHELLMEYPLAVHYHYQQLIVTQELRDYRGESRALCNLGNCLRAQGQLQEAYPYYLKDLEVCRLLKDESGEGVALLNLAVTSEGIGDLHKSIEWYSLLLSIKMRSDDMVGQVKYLLFLGALYYETGQLVKAKDYYTRVVDLSQLLDDRDLQVKALLILEEVQRAMKRQKHSNYYTVRNTFRRLKKRTAQLIHAHHHISTKRTRQLISHASNGSLSKLGGSGDTPMIQPRLQKGRVKLGTWSPGLKRWVSDGGFTGLQSDIAAPSPLVIHNTMATSSKAASLDDITWDDDITAPSGQFSVRDSVHGYLNDNRQLSYQLQDVLMSAAATNVDDEGVHLQRASSRMGLYSCAFGSLRHIQELRVIGQDMCQPVMELGLDHGGDEWKEWALSPNDDRTSVHSLPIDESLFEQQTTVHLEQPHPPNEQQPHPQDQNLLDLNDQVHSYQEQPRPSHQEQPHLLHDDNRSISPVTPLDGIQAVIQCLEAVLEEEQSEPDS